MKDLKVQVLLPKDVDEFEADNFLFKALNQQVNGDAHRESFDDPAMLDMAQRMEAIHDKIYAEMIQEINATLDEDYTQDGN